jgi:hypothetical protein
MKKPLSDIADVVRDDYKTYICGFQLDTGLLPETRRNDKCFVPCPD